MSENNDTGVRRRTFLTTAGSSALAFGVTGTAAAQGKGKNPEKSRKGANSYGMVPTPENAMTEADKEEQRARMTDRYGSEVAAEIFGSDGGQVGTNQTQENLVENATLVDQWEHHYEVRNDFNQLLANTDHFLNLYESNDTDGNGNTVYFFKSLNYSDDYDPGYYESHTEHMDTHVNLHDSVESLNNINPNGTVDVSGDDDYYFELNVGIATVGGSIYSTGGKISPDGDRLTFGDAGEFAWELNGNIEGTASLTGIADVRSSTGHYDFYWQTYTQCDVGSM